MGNQVRKADVDDLEFLDAEELQSDGSFVYLTSSVVSTDAGSRVVTIGVPADGEGIKWGRDHLAEAGDVVVLAGTSGAAGDGRYTVATILDDFSFSVVEPIGAATGGTIEFYYVPGARRIGFDPDGAAHIVSRHVQGALHELDSAIDAVSQLDHRKLRQLVHLADEGGPFEGFTTGAFLETTPAASPFPTSIVWWTSAAKTAKIVEENITYNPNATVAEESWKVYADDGITVLAEASDVISYSGVFETSRVRSVVVMGTVEPKSLTIERHRDVRQLVHLAAEGGPFEGFTSGAFREILPAATPFPTSIIWWASPAKNAKIVEETISYNGNQTVAANEWKVYAADGVTVLATVTDTIDYSGVFEVGRTRAIA